MTAVTEETILDMVGELARRVESGEATPAEAALLQSIDDADRELGVGEHYRPDDWCPDCHVRWASHGPSGEHWPYDTSAYRRASEPDGVDEAPDPSVNRGPE